MIALNLGFYSTLLGTLAAAIQGSTDLQHAGLLWVLLLLSAVKLTKWFLIALKHF